MHKYEIILYWSNEDDLFVADTPELPGCMAHGDSHEDSLDHAQVAIDLWLEASREIGSPIPQPRGELVPPQLSRQDLAAEPGFEPELRDPKSLVLPLHYSASDHLAPGTEGRTRTGTGLRPNGF